MNRKYKLCTLDLTRWELETAPPAARASGRAQRRLAKAFSRLAEIEQRRAVGQDSVIDRLVEKWVIWRELGALELQAFDEPASRIPAEWMVNRRHP